MRECYLTRRQRRNPSRCPGAELELTPFHAPALTKKDRMERYTMRGRGTCQGEMGDQLNRGIVEHLTLSCFQSNMSDCPARIETKDGTCRDKSNFCRGSGGLHSSPAHPRRRMASRNCPARNTHGCITRSIEKYGSGSDKDFVAGGVAETERAPRCGRRATIFGRCCRDLSVAPLIGNSGGTRSENGRHRYINGAPSRAGRL